MYYVSSTYETSEDMRQSAIVLFVVFFSIVVHSLTAGPCSVALSARLKVLHERQGGGDRAQESDGEVLPRCVGSAGAGQTEGDEYNTAAHVCCGLHNAIVNEYT